ncbi:MAG: MAPEG family protein [Mesorhizobium sp.]|nr:MAPEG family protein [Mesorhizobium sp.]
MTQTAILWPMIAHVALVFAVYVLLGLRRRQAVMAGEAKISGFRENQNEPPLSLFARNNLENQFELPMLFHAACLALFVSGAVGTVAVALAWLFIASRVIHTIIHVTSNRIRYRQPAFLAGFLLLGGMWALLAIHLATA